MDVQQQEVAEAPLVPAVNGAEVVVAPNAPPSQPGPGRPKRPGRAPVGGGAACE
jgi:hypothetical protein